MDPGSSEAGHRVEQQQQHAWEKRSPSNSGQDIFLSTIYIELKSHDVG